VSVKLTGDEKRYLLGKSEPEPERDASTILSVRIGAWPEQTKPAAYYGLAGEIVREISPHNEADDISLLVNLLVGVGNLIGRGPYFVAGAVKHYMNLFATVVGDTASARKGTCWAWADSLFRIEDETWAKDRIMGGLSSGEGLIWNVRDKIEHKTKDEGWETIDEGISDKRLLVIEQEFAGALKVMSRHGNTLSPVIRRAWESGCIQSMTKNSPAKATDAHISIIGHITKDELLRSLVDTEMANGFANRFIWICSKRDKYLPDGDALPTATLNSLAADLHYAVLAARKVTELKRDEKATELWRSVYRDLGDVPPGLYGAVIARGEAQVMRMACVYALLDGVAEVRVEHLRAALALWRYSVDSARFIFGASASSSTETEILDALRDGPRSQTDIYRIFDGDTPSRVLRNTLADLQRQGMVEFTEEKAASGKGRAAIVWKLAKKVP
jgi:hypothetical protein